MSSTKDIIPCSQRFVIFKVLFRLAYSELISITLIWLYSNWDTTCTKNNGYRIQYIQGTMKRFLKHQTTNTKIILGICFNITSSSYCSIKKLFRNWVKIYLQTHLQNISSPSAPEDKWNHLLRCVCCYLMEMNDI